MTVLDEAPPAVGTVRQDRRRTELARFLRACRARVAPEEVGLPAGPRRRTPGLRREEVAQLAGVGVTWYTWLEQGRPINASEQVLAAVTRALRLDATEREHLFRLAGVAPTSHAAPPTSILDPSTQLILDALAPLPAAVCNTRFDVLLHNGPYESLFGARRSSTPDGRFNSLWCTVTTSDCCNPFLNRAEAMPRMVAVLRCSYGRHVGEPVWEEHIRALSAQSAEFRELWERQEVAPPQTLLRVFKHPVVGVLRVNASYLSLPGVPDTYLVVYTPVDAENRELVERLADVPPESVSFGCDRC